jgi:hypothetical protein
VALALESGTPVIVHCSDGWDRTSQLCALAQLLVDPFYRTFAGFCTLVEKDFLAFGHMFARRLDPSSRQFSPVFLQFIDCVYQSLRQHPTAFEFTEAFLLATLDGATSGWFNTFAGNSDRDRTLASSPLPRLWDSLDYKALTNPAFAPPSDGGKTHVLELQLSIQALRLWPRLYLRTNPLASPFL